MKKSNFVLFLLCLVFSFCLLLIIGIGVLMFIIFTGTDSSEYPSKEHFRYLKYDPSKNISSFGFMDLRGNEITKSPSPVGFYKESTGSYFLVTPFGSHNQEYKCSGTCMCEDDARRSARILSRSLIFLVSVSTSSYAVYLAKQHFFEECNNQYHSSCSSIRSKVENCVVAVTTDDGADIGISEEELQKEIDELKDVIHDEFKNEEEEEIKEKIKEFKCKGFCYPVEQEKFLEQWMKNKGMEDSEKQIFREQYYDLQRLSNEYGCEEMMLERHIDNDRSTQFFLEGSIPKQMMFAKRVFVEQHLGDYCLKQSRQEIRMLNKWGQDHMSTFSFCTAYDEEDMNANTDCVPMF